MFKEAGKTKKKTFSSEFPTKNKQSPRGSAANHNRNPLRQHFRAQQQQRWQRNTTSQTANKMIRLKKQVATTFCNISVKLVPLEKLENVHPLVKEMFPEELKQNVPLGGRISNFVQSWEKLTKDQGILEIAKGYKIPLLRTPVQAKICLNTPPKENQQFLVKEEIKEMLEKGPIKKVSQHKDQQFFSCNEKKWGLPSSYKSENSK